MMLMNVVDVLCVLVPVQMVSWTSCLQISSELCWKIS